MTTLTEEARWAKLRDALEARFDSWFLSASGVRAAEIVYDLRRSGWRAPLPDDALMPRWKPPAVRRLDPERVRQHAQACRDALRQTTEDDE